jgi:hypothetical protein
MSATASAVTKAISLEAKSLLPTFGTSLGLAALRAPDDIRFWASFASGEVCSAVLSDSTAEQLVGLFPALGSAAGGLIARQNGEHPALGSTAGRTVGYGVQLAVLFVHTKFWERPVLFDGSRFQLPPYLDESE